MHQNLEILVKRVVEPNTPFLNREMPMVIV